MQQKKGFHINNLHNGTYNIDTLVRSVPELKPFVKVTPAGTKSIDFSNNKAVFLLNKALIKSIYKINDWKILPNSLCPPIPGRVDYIHHLADLINGAKNARILDIGTGSSIIYPLLGAKIYDWNFVATDSHVESLENAASILKANPDMKNKIEIRLQQDSEHILKGIIKATDDFDAIMCNPPFYKSREEHWQKVLTKNEKLYKNKDIPSQNFGGLSNELWYKGGEKAFVSKLIYESFDYRTQLNWVSSIISDKDHIKSLVAILEYHKVPKVEIIPMHQGQKVTRILAWKLK